jgi:hypothetical protein
LFNLIPTPEVEEVGGDFVPALYERFWLCDECCKRMTLVWGGNEVKLVPLTNEAIAQPAQATAEADSKQRPKRRAVSAGLHWR